MPATILFDLDGTLLPMDQEAFTKGYFRLLSTAMAPRGYEPGRLIDTVWAGTAAMVKNDGARSNEAAFWAVFASVYGEDAVARDRSAIDRFYDHEFLQTKAFCGYNPDAADAVRRLKAEGHGVALATNPIFPGAAIRHRVRWAGLDPAEFLLCTDYTNSRFCKPNPAYFRSVAEALRVPPEACLMVGNDASEDLSAREAGMDVFLLTDCLINRAQIDLTPYPHGGFADLLAYTRRYR